LIINTLHIFAANLLAIPLFLFYYAMAIYFRKKPAYHARFMVMTALPFMGPAVARIPFNTLWVDGSLWVLFFVVEAFNRKVFKPYLLGIGFYALNLGFVAYLVLANQSLLDKIWHLFFYFYENHYRLEHL
jgi:hypothetical protein